MSTPVQFLLQYILVQLLLLLILFSFSHYKLLFSLLLSISIQFLVTDP